MPRRPNIKTMQMQDTISRQGAEIVVLRNENRQLRDVIRKLEEQTLKSFASLFPNYAWTDMETAIDLMRDEILTARNERDSMVRLLTSTVAQLCDRCKVGHQAVWEHGPPSHGTDPFESPDGCYYLPETCAASHIHLMRRRQRSSREVMKGAE